MIKSNKQMLCDPSSTRFFFMKIEKRCLQLWYNIQKKKKKKKTEEKTRSKKLNKGSEEKYHMYIFSINSINELSNVQADLCRSIKREVHYHFTFIHLTKDWHDCDTCFMVILHENAFFRRGN